MLSVTSDVSPSLLVFVGVFGAAYVLANRQKKYGNRTLPPSLPSLPIVGSLPYIGFENVGEYFLKVSKQLGPVFSLKAGARYLIVVNGDEAVTEALLTKGADFADRFSFYTELATNPQKKGVVWRQFHDGYRAEKHLVLKVFRQLGLGTDVIESIIQSEVGEFIKHVKEIIGDKAFDPVDNMMPLVSNVILTIMFGHRFEMDDPLMRRFVSDTELFGQHALPELNMFALLRFLPSYRRRIRLVRDALMRIVTFAAKELVDCLKDETNSESFSKCYAEKKGAKFNGDDFKFILRDLSTAGLHTTSILLLSGVVSLANHSRVQKRLQAEIDSVISKDRLPTWDDRTRLPYVEATILEIMRQKAVVPLGSRATLCDTELNGYFIPNKTMVILNIYGCHMDPDVWEKPEEFRPERFIDDKGNVTSLKDKLISFGLGKRSCLGEQLGRQQVFLFFVGVLQHFDILPPEGCDHVEYHDLSHNSCQIRVSDTIPYLTLDK